MATSARKREREQELSKAIEHSAMPERTEIIRDKLRRLDELGFGRPSYDLESPYGSGQHHHHSE